MLEIIPYIGFLFISVIISAYSQILLKKSAQKTYKSFFKEYINPYVICGYGIFFMAIFLDMLGLRKVLVSYIPIIESSSYVFIIIFSRIFLGEKINRRKTIAISAILLGIGIYLLQNFTLYEWSNSIISDISIYDEICLRFNFHS